MTVQIKRYANRKLYNTQTSRYITLGGISDLVREGHEIQVLDNETGNDISSLVLSRVLVDTERKGAPNPDLGETGDGPEGESPVLGELVQRQLASMFALLRRYADDVQDNLSDVSDKVVRWIHAHGNGDAAADASASAVLEGLALPGSARGEQIEAWLGDAILRAIREADLPTRADLAELQSQLDELAAAVQKLQTRN